MEATINRPGTLDTRHKLLEAATRVFARNGLEGATTREIAREAGVNEVTLFRHFQSKDNLLAAVLQHTFGQPEEEATQGDKQAVVNPGDLHEGLRGYVRKYETLLRNNMLLLRTLIGEIHRHSEHEARVLKGIFAPLKVNLIAAIHAARERGHVRTEVDPLVAADLLWSMIFMEVLRRTSPLSPGYSTEQYIDHALDLFVRGIRTKPGPARKAPAPQP